MSRLSFLLLFFFCFTGNTFSQSTKTNTLLWRISGNQLAKPSYLFGTMHVTDKKAFHFQDSLYRFLEEADAFAMEVHPDSVTAMISDYMNRDEEVDWDKVLGQDEIKQLEKQLSKAAQKLPAGSKGRQLKYLLTKLMNADKVEKDAMDTFMDAYLYEVARRNTKEIYGLEQVADQLVALSVLPRGLQVNNFVKLLDKWNPSMASPIHELYYKEDIEQLEGFYRNMFTDSALHVFLYNRNAVMVKKMDSLMKGKSLFTAVGAGHLAGKKGVIELLRQKGYKVEPVFSANRINATDYQLKAFSADWPVQQNSNHGFTYSMPSAPRFQSGQNGNEVAIHYDLGNGLTYMVVSGVLSGEEKGAELAAAQKHLDQFIISTSAKLVKLDTILVNNKPTLEALCKAKDNSHFRFREMVQGHMFYVFTLSGRNKETLYSNGAEQFFTSYKALPVTTPNWTSNHYADAGFAIKLPVPVKVEQTPVEEAAEKIAWKTYNAFDYRSAITYTMYNCKALAGSELLDGYFFEHFINNISNNTDGGAIAVKDTLIGGFAAKHFTSAPYNGITIKGLIVERLNQCYFISAEYSNAAAEKDADQFLASFSLTPYAVTEWKNAPAPDNSFTVWAPGNLQLLPPDEEAEESGTSIFYSYDSATAENYLINRKRLSKYLWADNVDSVYNYWVSNAVNTETDTILVQKNNINGSIPVRELLLQNKQSGIQAKMLFVLDGTDMYELMAIVPPSFADTLNINRFIHSFTIHYPQKEIPVLTNSPQLLFMDLQLENDAYFTNAYRAIADLPFNAKEVPMLMQQSLYAFPSTAEGYESVNTKLLYKLQQVMNTLPAGKDSMLQFVKQHYHSLEPEVEHVQYTMLDIVAEDARPQAYQLLHELLQQKPADGAHYALFYTLNTQPKLAAQLFPLLYNYATDSVLGSAVIALTNRLIDSSYLSIESAQAHKTKWLQLLNNYLKPTLKSDDVAPIVYNLLELAGKLKLPELNAMLPKYTTAKEPWVKMEATTALLKANQPVPTAVLQNLAADKYFRTELYRQLKEAKKTTLFPAAYRSQKSMAEGYIYQSLKDEDELEGEPEFIYIKTIEHMYRGEKKRFFLFRINLAASEESGEKPVSYLSIAGPFSLNATEIDIEIKDNISGTYYDSNFDGIRLDATFKKYIQPFTKKGAE